MTCRCAGSPYACTIRFSPPANERPSAPRTCSIDGVVSNCVMTTVPPANSMPIRIPLVAIVTTPAMMTINERTMACQRHRRKS